MARSSSTHARAASATRRDDVATSRIQYTASIRPGVYRASSFAARGNSHSATPRIMNITNPTSTAWACAETSRGCGHTPSSSRWISSHTPRASPVTRKPTPVLMNRRTSVYT